MTEIIAFGNDIFDDLSTYEGLLIRRGFYDIYVGCILGS